MPTGLGHIPAMAYDLKSSFQNAACYNARADKEMFAVLHQIHHRGQVSQIMDRFGLPNNWGDNAAYLEVPGD